MRLPVPAALAAALAVPAVAPAATGDTLSLKVDAPVVEWGTQTGFGGALRAGDAPVAGARLRLASRELPAEKGFFDDGVESTTAPDGGYGYTTKPNRTFLLFAYAPDRDVRSPTRRISVLPRQRLSRRHPSRNVLVETLRVAVHRSARLDGSRVFLYLGRYGAKRLPFKGTAPLRRTGPGTYKMVKRFTLPRQWNGGWRFVSCYRAPQRTALVDPRAKPCSRRSTLYASAGAAAAGALGTAQRRSNAR